MATAQPATLHGPGRPAAVHQVEHQTGGGTTERQHLRNPPRAQIADAGDTRQSQTRQVVNVHVVFPTFHVGGDGSQSAWAPASQASYAAAIFVRMAGNTAAAPTAMMPVSSAYSIRSCPSVSVEESMRQPRRSLER